MVLTHHSMAMVCLLLLRFAMRALGGGVPDGWKSSDRFLGFRFELNPASDGDIKSIFKDKADDLFCFGWVQDSQRGTIVGEARCNKSAGIEMAAFLSDQALAAQDGINSKQIRLLEYPDTKIRLHFSSFKIVSPGRITCFRDEPHKCSHLYYEGEDGTPLHDR